MKKTVLALLLTFVALQIYAAEKQIYGNRVSNLFGVATGENAVKYS